MVKRVLVVLVVFLGCHKTADKAPPVPSAAAAVAIATPTAPVDAGAVEETTDAGLDAEAGPFAELPSQNAVIETLGSERVVGFSDDDRYLGFEISTCDPCPPQFHFRGPGVPALDFAYFWEPGADAVEARQKANDAAVEARLASLGAPKTKDGRALRGPFPYTDLLFATTSEQAPNGSVTLLVGAHVPGEPPVYPIRIPLGMHPLLQSTSAPGKRFAGLSPAARKAAIIAEIGGDPTRDGVLAYLNVTKDGRDLGAVGIGQGDYWWESGGVARMPTTKFVAQIYGETAKHMRAEGKATEAADLVAKAALLTKPAR